MNTTKTDRALLLVHPEDRAKVLSTHLGLPGQTLRTTVENGLRHGRIRPAPPVTIDAFLGGYIDAALWLSTDEDGTPMDSFCTRADLAPATLAEMAEECADFQRANAADLAAAQGLGETSARAGHDFWLTRNGHGAGFWDRGLGDVGERLTEAAHACGESDLYIGDDRKVYAC